MRLSRRPDIGEKGIGTPRNDIFGQSQSDFNNYFLGNIRVSTGIKRLVEALQYTLSVLKVHLCINVWV